jgi:trimeric autotransporter adhesin
MQFPSGGRARACSRAKMLMLLPLLAIMQACGDGGGGSGAGDPSPSPGPVLPGPVSATVQFDSTAQRLVAAWVTATDATRYRVLFKPDEDADFAPLSGADDLAPTTLSFAFAAGFTIQWQAAALRVEACNSVGCSTSPELPLLPELVAASARKEFIDVLGDDAFSVASSADGNVLAVGAPSEAGADGQAPGIGAVYVFTRTATVWNTQPIVVRAPNGEAHDNFGYAVSLSADGATLVVGATGEDGSTTSSSADDNNDALSAGAAYVFVRNGAAYEFEGYLKAQPILDTAIAGDQFGWAVAIAADAQTVVVGAIAAEGPLRPIGFDEGAAFVFTRAGTVWTQRAVLGGAHADGNERDWFGISVAISADGATIAVGALGDDGDALSTGDAPNVNAPFAGAAYVFTTDNRTEWPLQAYLKAPNAQAGDAVGANVALAADGDTLAVGAPSENGDAASTLAASNDNLPNSGAVYVFTRTAASWSATPAYLKPSSGSVNGVFGSSLSLSGDGRALAIGAPYDVSLSPPEGYGSAFVFVRVGSSWLEQIALADTVVSEVFGTVALSADGRTLFIAAATSLIAPQVPGGIHVH